MVKFLLEYGASTTVGDNFGCTPLLALVLWGDAICFKDSKAIDFYEAVNYLLDHGSDPYMEQDYVGNTAIALHKGSVEVQKSLLNSLPEPEFPYEYAEAFLEKYGQNLYGGNIKNAVSLARNLFPARDATKVVPPPRDGRLLCALTRWLGLDEYYGVAELLDEVISAGVDVHGRRAVDGGSLFWVLLHHIEENVSFDDFSSDRDLDPVNE